MEKEYNWAPVDRLFEIAEKHDKLVLLRFIGGKNRLHSPDWIWKKVTHYVDGVTPWKANVRTPYLGDPVFQELWNGFLREAGKRHGTHPRLQRIAMSSGLDQEMYYIRPEIFDTAPATSFGGKMSDEKMERLKRFCPKGLDQCVDDLVWSWHQTFETYKRAFPDKAFVIDLSDPIVGVEGIEAYSVVERIALDASTVFGPRLYIEQDGLSDKERSLTAQEALQKKRQGARSNRSLMLDLEEKHMLGFELMLPPELKNRQNPLAIPPDSLFYEDLRRCIDIGLTYPIRFVEVWIDCLNDPANEPHVRYLREQLEGKIARATAKSRP